MAPWGCPAGCARLGHAAPGLDQAVCRALRRGLRAPAAAGAPAAGAGCGAARRAQASGWRAGRVRAGDGRLRDGADVGGSCGRCGGWARVLAAGCGGRRRCGSLVPARRRGCGCGGGSRVLPARGLPARPRAGLLPGERRWLGGGLRARTGSGERGGLGRGLRPGERCGLGGRLGAGTGSGERRGLRTRRRGNGAGWPGNGPGCGAGRTTGPGQARTVVRAVLLPGRGSGTAERVLARSTRWSARDPVDGRADGVRHRLADPQRGGAERRQLAEHDPVARAHPAAAADAPARC